jgi:BirA family biotin operon repressor/biotin-[acetyl-CoA-carboxylase] ligase
LINLLADGRFYSGEALGQLLGISRSGIWKSMKQLEKLGLTVHAVQGKGYRLADPIELMSEELIAAYFSAPVRERVEKLEIFTEIDSTNRHLLKQVYLKRQGAHVCLAEYQSAGKGRRGRQWVAPFGKNVCLSVLWTFNKGISALEGLSLVSSLAVVRALSKFGIFGLGIKWPNDVYSNGRKLAGILLEMSGENSGPCHLVIGIGLNLRMNRDDAATIEQPWIDLYSVTNGIPIARNRLIAEIINQLVDVLMDFETTGWSAYAEEWASYDILSGRSVNIITAQEQFDGHALGVDATGALVVDTKAGRMRLMSGDVSIRPA